MSSFKNMLYTLILLLGCFFTNVESVYINRFNTTDNGNIAFTGNTLGLSKAKSVLQPGTEHSIGTFITTDLNSQANSFPPGTTFDWTENSSSAVLDLPAGSVVLYAELIWSGGYGMKTLLNNLNTPVTLTTPQNTEFSITPDNSTAQQTSTYYMRNQNVTAIVQAAGPGVYTVGGVPADLTPSFDSANAAGWTLGVVYQNGNMITSILNLFVGCEPTSSTFTPPPSKVMGFCTPTQGELAGRLFVSAIEGDAVLTGDCFRFGPTTNLTAAHDVFGTGNIQNNFFSSQINTYLAMITNPLTGKLGPIGSGQLDMRGTFGDRNHIIGEPGTNIIAGRQGYDITSVDVSNQLMHGQMEAYAQGTTAGDRYTINALAIQIATSAPIIIPIKKVNGQDSVMAKVGQILTFTVSFENVGEWDAMNLHFMDPLPPQLVYVPNSTKINGVPVTPDPDLSKEFPIGDLAVGETFVVEFKAQVGTNASEDDLIPNTAFVDYSFMSCGTSETLTLESSSSMVYIDVPSSDWPGPKSPKAQVTRFHLLNADRFQVEVRWDAAAIPDTTQHYRIYSGNRIIGKVGVNDPYVFTTCFRSKKDICDLKMTAFYGDGFESEPVNVVVNYE